MESIGSALGLGVLFLFVIVVGVIISSRPSPSKQMEPPMELKEGDHFVILHGMVRKLGKYETDPQANRVLAIGQCGRYSNRPHAMFVRVMDPRVIEMTHVVDLATREVIAENVD